MSVFQDINSSLQANNNRTLNQTVQADTTLSHIKDVSTFNKSFNQATTFNSGKAVPILLQECYPGDYYKIDLTSILRLSAMTSTPYMNINVDINFFFIPYNQIDKEFVNLMGENNEYGYSDTDIEFPQLIFDGEFKYTENDLATYFNIPINADFNGDKINIYPFLAYGKVINEWYRDQNLQDSVNITTCFNDTRTINSSTYKTDMTYLESIIYGKGLAPTSKLPSYFTTNLPYQQKGQALKIGGFSLEDLYVTNNDFGSELAFSPKYHFANGSTPGESKMLVTDNSGYTYFEHAATPPNTGDDAYLSLKVKSKSGSLPFTINDLRMSIVSQHILENFALCGSRYVEQLNSIWGITIDPKSINRTELIGGFNQDMIFNSVLQTSQSTESSLLGKIGTNLYNSLETPTVEYAAEQHGYILGIVTVRTMINNGGQGLPRHFRYTNRYDLHNPLMNGIGEQPTRCDELFYNDTNKFKNSKTFGWNEPYINTKYNIDNASAFMSLKSKTSLFSMFLFGEKYEDTPLLTAKWMEYDPNIIGNTLFKATDSTIEFYHQFAGLFMFNIEYTTMQPLFNSPRIDYI